MIILLSPAKRLDYDSPLRTRTYSYPEMTAETEELVRIMSRKSPEEIGALMKISEPLAELTWDRFQDWEPQHTPANARQALLAFDGDVYRGMQIDRFTQRDFAYAQRRLRILSGLHGVLKPLDLIQPYRLEMGTKLPTSKSADLYGFWSGAIANRLRDDLAAARPKVIINLASREYFKAVDATAIGARVVTPVFLDYQRGEFRTIGLHAKRARGSMAAWLILERIGAIKALNRFDGLGYRYSAEHSSSTAPAFVRTPS